MTADQSSKEGSNAFSVTVSGGGPVGSQRLHHDVILSPLGNGVSGLGGGGGGGVFGKWASPLCCCLPPNCTGLGGGEELAMRGWRKSGGTFTDVYVYVLAAGVKPIIFVKCCLWEAHFSSWGSRYY